jgi:radical SAM superfamily enzyme YgiQ (UPF0313 family)
MKILLVRPRIVNFINAQAAPSFDNSVGATPPLGIACIAAFLERYHYAVSILDCETQCSSAQDIKRIIEREEPDMVGVSAITTNIHGALEVCNIAKACGKIVVMGGTHMAIFPLETLQYPSIDYGIVGEGEQPTLELVRALESGGDVSQIAGIAYKKNGEIRANGIAKNNDLDSLPWPAYHLLHLEKYEMINTGPMVSMFTTRGCPYKCTFCFRNPILDKVRKKNPIRVVDEIEYINKEFGIKYINFVDETITLDPAHIRSICAEIIRRKLRMVFQAPTRVNHVDEALLSTMRRAGFDTLRFGVESADEYILKLIDKRITLEETRRAFALCRKTGIKSVAYFILGYIGETAESIIKTIRFAKELKADYSVFFPATPMPGTKLFDMAVEKGLVERNYWLEFVLGKRNDPLPFLFPDTDRYIYKAYRQLYFNPSYIAKMLCKKETILNFRKYLTAALNLLRMKFQR